jgi:hypothetical protein
MAVMAPCSPLKIAGMTRLTPMLAVLRIPHWIFRMNLSRYSYQPGDDSFARISSFHA